MGHVNPLLELPAAEALLDLPADHRCRVEAVFRQLRHQVNQEAELAWARRNDPMAGYLRAVANYSRQVAHALRRGRSTAERVGARKRSCP